MLSQTPTQNETYSTFNLALRSLIFNVYTGILIIICSLMSLFIWPFSIRIRYKVINFFLSLYFKALKSICGLSYEVEGKENIPKDRVAIICSKHSSTFETFLLPTIFPEPAPIAKRELLWVPFFGWGLAVCNPITINRKDKKSAMQQIIEKGTKLLAAGRWILFFPEGTRVPYGTIGHYKLGGARLAVATGVPLIPVAHNAGRYWPRRTFIKRPGVVKVVIGSLIESHGQTPEQILEQAKTWIETTIARL